MSACSSKTEDRLRCDLDSALSRYYAACAAEYSLGSARRYVDAEIARRIAKLESERKQAEQAVRDARWRLQSFLSAAPVSGNETTTLLVRAAAR